MKSVIIINVCICGLVILGSVGYISYQEKMLPVKCTAMGIDAARTGTELINKWRNK